MTEISTPIAPRNAIAVLRRFAQPRKVIERCDLCALPLAVSHQHLLELHNRQLHCACDPCAILFDENATGKYRRIPRSVEHFTDFQITDMQWESLGIPIAMAFFSYNSALQQITTMYPSPAGATEASLTADIWHTLAEQNPRLAKLQPDVEALLVNRMHDTREYYRVPIDQCFKLVGLIRTHWRGLSGGKAVWQEIKNFFHHLNTYATKVSVHA